MRSSEYRPLHGGYPGDMTCTIGEKLDRMLRCGASGFEWRDRRLDRTLQEPSGRQPNTFSYPCRKPVSVVGSWAVWQSAGSNYKGSYFATCNGCGATTHIGIEGILSDEGMLDVIGPSGYSHRSHMQAMGMRP